MDRDGVQRFLEALEAENIRDDGAWISCSCPLAPWLHAAGTDHKPSFGVKVNDSGPSGWYCFTCDMGGSLTRLIHAVWWNSEEYPAEAASVIWDDEVFGDFDVLRLVKRHPLRFPPRLSALAVPETILVSYPVVTPSMDVFRYLAEDRRISWETIQAYQVRAFEDRNERQGVAFPILSTKSAVLDMYVRMVDSKTFFRLNAELTGSEVEYKCNYLLFGNHLLDRGKPIWVCEAPLDAMRLHTLGIKNVGATCGPPKRTIFQNLYAPKGIVLAFDSDDSGKRFARVARRLMKQTLVHVVDWGVVGKKDANELSSIEEVREVLKRRQIFLPTFE